ncbi:MAG TPA: DUF5985 family protein [Steroidobacteraceae bacterium]|nr:DUF5985 family protein [Steroidobacteraceae bacterium]
MAEIVYALCAATSLLCATLLFRAYRSQRTRLLAWTSIGFAGLALNNMLLFVDLIVLPDIDLFSLRAAASLAAMTAFVYGLIRESK